MNAIFTIVAKNYLGRAITLGDSVKKYHPHIDFYIFLSDEFEPKEESIHNAYPIIQAKDIHIPNFWLMAYKYNILEFSTGIKPFCFTYLFDSYHYEKIIYFDPDIYLFNSVDPIFDDLKDYSIVVTPHILTIEESYTGIVTEEELLYVGMFNLGFIALRNNEVGNKILSWWQNRLFYKGYADKEDALHVDQKWIDFLICFFPDQIKISRCLGYNMAVWNIHEREIYNVDGLYYVRKRGTVSGGELLVFFHFAGFVPENTATVHKGHPSSQFDKYPDLLPLFEIYRKHMLDNRFSEYLRMPYKYSTYDNGVKIIDFQRRLFRKIEKNNSKYTNPFQSGGDSYYKMLEKNKLIFNPQNISGIGQYNSRAEHNVPKIIINIERLLRKLLKVVGIKNYLLLLKIFKEFYRYERHQFLIADLSSDNKK